MSKKTKPIDLPLGISKKQVQQQDPSPWSSSVVKDKTFAVKKLRTNFAFAFAKEQSG